MTQSVKITLNSYRLLLQPGQVSQNMQFACTVLWNYSEIYFAHFVQQSKLINAQLK